MSNKLIFSVFTILLLISITLIGCSNNSESQAKENEVKTKDNIVIGITQNNVGVDSYQTTYDKAFREYATEQGVQTSVLDAGGDVARQISQIEDFIQQNVDVIIIWPTNGKAVVPAVRNAQRAGIPVLITNSKIDESGYEFIAAFSGPDNVTQGRNAAEMMIEALGGTGKIVEITGLPGYTTAVERSEGFHEVIEAHGGIEIIESQPGDWNRERAQRVMENFLTKYPDIDGIYAADDNMGVGALNSIRERGLQGKIKITGATLFGDGYDAIKQGLYYGSVYQSPVDDAKNALDTAIDIALGKDVEFFNFFETPKVTEENIDDFEKPVF